MGSTEEEVREHLLVNIDGARGVDLPAKKAKLQVRDLTKQSETTGEMILSKVNLDVPEGMIMGIIGPSGSGKSTLLRALNRLWEPPSGSVLLDGHDICKLDVLTLRRRVGMLFQLPALFDGSVDEQLRHGDWTVPIKKCKGEKNKESAGAGSVAENVRYGPQLKGKKLTEEEVKKLLSLADLDPALASKAASQLSVGQAQRVALARTLANDPEVLLLDEPTSALDPISTQNIEEAIVRLKESRRMTTVLVSHSVKQIQRIADLVCLLVAGEMVEVLEPARLSEAQHPMARRFLQLS
ncbi:ABC transporter [Musa troglodytarum]|uniref:ABC transporter n=1 Tax=Musa troglodytarum TaxID=320322 RepID=A0A9E7KJS0_9LILI|nr:ABC transporter [Musa troglodytarum]